MLLSSFSAGNSEQRVQFEAHGNAAGYFIKQFEELDFGVLQSWIRHVVDKCDADTIVLRGRVLDRTHRMTAPSLGPVGRNPAAVDDQWHNIPPELTVIADSSRFMPWPLSSAWARSSRISSICSMPTLSRSISGVTPTFSCSSGDNCRCVVDAG